MSKRRLPTEKEAARLRQMHRDRIALMNMEKEFHIGRTTLIAWHTHLKLEVRSGHPNKCRTEDLSDDEKAEFISYYADRRTQQEVLKKYNISVKTFKNWLADLEIEEQKPTRSNEFGNKANPIGQRNVKTRIEKEQEKASEPFVSIKKRFQNLNGHNSATLSPHR